MGEKYRYDAARLSASGQRVRRSFFKRLFTALGAIVTPWKKRPVILRDYAENMEIFGRDVIIDGDTVLKNVVIKNCLITLQGSLIVAEQSVVTENTIQAGEGFVIEDDTVEFHYQ